jgi:hypothetical protein
MSKTGRQFDLEECSITNLVIVNCHGVTKSSRKRPYDNSITVEYPTILTAHLGTQTFLPAYVTVPAVDICEILKNHIDNALAPSGITIISLAEIVRAIKNQAVDTGTGALTVFAEGTPIKPKIPGDSFQNIELFCPGIRKDSGPERVPVGNTDGVWVCNLVDPYSCENVTRSMFNNGLTNGENDVVNENDYYYDKVEKRYVITKHSWLNKNNTIATYRDLIERLKERQDLYPIATTAILIVACRVFDDDDPDVDGDAVPSKPEAPKSPKKGRTSTDAEIEREIQQLLRRQEEITRERQILHQKHQQWLLQQHQQLNQAGPQNVFYGGSSKRNTRKRGRSNKKRRYTKRKKYFKSMRRVKVNKLKKRRTRKYKNKNNL